VHSAVGTAALGAPLPDVDTVDETVTVGDRVLSVVRPRAGEARLGEESFGEEIVMPYWADVWPSGVALARALAARSLRGMRVLELGCGALALPSIVAGLAGARAVATDWSADAIAFAARNALRSRASIETALCSWKQPELLEARGPWDLVLAADVLYEEEHAGHLADLLPRLLERRGSAWVADPDRDPAERFLELAGDRFEIHTTELEPHVPVRLHRLRRRI
jgi:predicted nicotinamide N-methyase